MFTHPGLEDCLRELGLSQVDAARLLSVDPRTMRRWVAKPEDMPGPAEHALRAWQRLHRLGLAWSPDGAIGEGDPNEIAEQIARYRDHAISLDEVIRSVRARGGPAAPWNVDLTKKQATLGPMKVSFYRLANGGFSPANYSRSDEPPDVKRDWTLLEDAFACIATAIAEAGPDWGR
jgi:hypothetical protein